MSLVDHCWLTQPAQWRLVDLVNLSLSLSVSLCRGTRVIFKL